MGGDVNNTIIMYVSAIMEVKSSMGVIVAAPTAGSCGALPGAIIGMATSLDLNEDEIVKAMLAAGLIGVFVAAHATFAAEVGGCMAECGSGSGMAAAALVGMAKGSLAQSLSAASLALQNVLGLICDPIGNRVEAPCLGRNVMAATNAVSCANMALSDYNHLIPLDEVVETMKKVGDAIPNTLRCTGLGGLAITKTAKKIEAMLNQQEQEANKTFFKVC
jgi:L-serine dehydratase